MRTVSENTYKHFKNESRNKGCVLFGINGHIEKIINTIKNDVTIRFIVDNDCEKWGSSIAGYEVKSPQVLQDIKHNETVVLITTIHVGPAERFLSEMGIESYPFFMFFDIANELEYYKNIYIMFKNSHLL